MATDHTGIIVIRNGLKVSLAECEWRSNVRKTSTVPSRSAMAPIAIPSSRVFMDHATYAQLPFFVLDRVRGEMSDSRR